MNYSEISIIEDANIYQSKAGNGINDGKYFRSHMLIEYIANPKKFKRKYIDGAIKEKRKQCFEKGTAVHTYVLDGQEAFEKNYSIGYPLNKQGNEFGADTKAVEEHISLMALAGKKVVGQKEYQDILRINEEIKSHKEASEIIKTGLNERVLRANYEGVDCQIRIDNYTDKFGMCDLKKTRDMTSFIYDAGGDYGYWIQAGFYAKIFEEATKEKARFNWIAVEDVEPFEVCFYPLDDSHLDYAKRLVETGILEYKESIKNNSFLTGREGLQIATWWRAETEEGNIQ